MTVREYQLEAKRTCPDLGHKSYNLLHMEMGLYTELAGELLDCYKKWLAYQKPLDFVNISEEIADCMWYIVNEATFNEYEFDEDFVPKTTMSHSEEVSLVIFDILNVIQKRASNNYLRYSDMVDDLFKIATLAGVDFFQALEKNIAKLKIRYPDKFDADLAVNRDTEKERAVL